MTSGDRHDLPPAREALAVLHVPTDASPGVFAADGAFDDTAFRASVAALGFTPDIARNPRKTGRPKHRGFVPGRWVVERTHPHLGAFRAIRIRWCRLLHSYEAIIDALCIAWNKLTTDRLALFTAYLYLNQVRFRQAGIIMRALSGQIMILD